MSEAKWTGVLSTTEPRNEIGILNVRQGNLNSETVEFQIIQNNKPYDLTGTKVNFCANFGLSAVQKSAVVKDAVKGIITFTFNDQSMQEVGRQMAYFQITKDEIMIDSTQDFEFRIESSILSRKMEAGSYIESFEKVLETLGDNAALGLAKKIDENNEDVTAQLVEKAQKTQANSIQQQVNDLVLGAVGNGNNAEVIQARTDSKGSKFITVKDHLDNIERMVKENIDYLSSVTWEQGNLSNGNVAASANRIRTSDFLKAIKDFSIKVQSGYKFTVHRYDESFVYHDSTTWITGITEYKVVFNLNYPIYKFSLAKEGDTNLLPSEGINLTAFYEHRNVPSKNTVGTDKFDSEAQFDALNPQVRFDLMSGDMINLFSGKDEDFKPDSQYQGYTEVITGDSAEYSITGYIKLKKHETLYATLNGENIFGGNNDTKLVVHDINKKWLSTVRTNKGYDTTTFVATQDCFIRIQYPKALMPFISTVNHKLIGNRALESYIREIDLKQNISAFTFGAGNGLDVCDSVLNGAFDYSLKGQTLAFNYGAELNFKDKKNNNTTINDNVSKKVLSEILSSPSEFPNEITTEEYVKISEPDELRAFETTTQLNKMPQMLFSFDLIKEFENRYGLFPIKLTGNAVNDKALKVEWLKNNVSKGMIDVYWKGYGESPSGNKAYFKQWGGSWQGSTQNATNAPSELWRSVAMSNLDSEGLLHLIAYTDKSDGVTASTIYTEHIRVNFELIPQYRSVGEGTVNENASKIIITSSDDDNSNTNEFNLALPLRSLSKDIYDQVDNTGTIIRRISDWFPLNMSLPFTFENSRNGFELNGYKTDGYKEVSLPVSTFPNIKNKSINIKVIKYNGLQLDSINGALDKDASYMTTEKLVIHIPNNSSGWTNEYTPTQDEIKAYFGGYKICKADGTTWDGISTKHWVRLNSPDVPSTTLPTTESRYYTPYKMLYELNTPNVEEKKISQLIGYRGGEISISSGRVIPEFNYKVRLEEGKVFEKVEKKEMLKSRIFSGDVSHKLDDIAIEKVSSIPLNLTSRYNTISVNPFVTHQKFLGVGTCLTEASAYLLMEKMTKEQRHLLLDELFNVQSAGMSTLRISMGTTDFRVGDNYFYNDVVDDYDMLNFSVGIGLPGAENATKDLKWLIPVLLEILEINPDVRIIACPWLFPEWMDVDVYTDELGKSLAIYFRKYLETYKTYNIPIHGISAINEPELTFQNRWTGTQLADFMTDHLAPMLNKAAPNVKLIALEVSWDATEYFESVNEKSSPYIDALGFHTYRGNMSDSEVHRFLKNNKDKDIYLTERRTILNDHVFLKSQQMLGEIATQGIQRGVSLITIWNLALDERTLPNFGGTLGRQAAITINSSGTGYAKRNLEYYMLRALSQNVKEGAVRIESTNYNLTGVDKQLGSVAFKNLDGSISVMISNLDMGTREAYVRLLGEIYKINVPAYGFIQIDTGKDLNVSLPLPDGILPTA